MARKLFREALEAATAAAEACGCTCRADGINVAGRLRLRIDHPNGQWGMVGVSGSPKQPGTLVDRIRLNVRRRCRELEELGRPLR